jgi:hypothetical protein
MSADDPSETCLPQKLLLRRIIVEPIPLDIIS